MKCSSDAVTARAAAVAAVTAVSSGLRHEMGHTWFQSFHCSRDAGACFGTYTYNLFDSLTVVTEDKMPAA